MIVYHAVGLLPEQERKEHGLALLTGAMETNPYNLVVTDALPDFVKTSSEQLALLRKYRELLATLPKPPGSAPALGTNFVLAQWNARLGRLPFETGSAKDLLAYLQESGSHDYAMLQKCRFALDGQAKVLADAETKLQGHLASARSPQACKDMAALINGTAANITDANAKNRWLTIIAAKVVATPAYLAAVKGGQRITVDETLTTVSQLKIGMLPKNKKGKPIGVVPVPELNVLWSKPLAELTNRFKTHVADPARDPGKCAAMASQIKITTAQLTTEAKTPDRAKQWLETLAASIKGREMYNALPNRKAKTKVPMRDVSADVIATLLAPAPPPAAKKTNT